MNKNIILKKYLFRLLCCSFIISTMVNCQSLKSDTSEGMTADTRFFESDMFSLSKHPKAESPEALTRQNILAQTDGLKNRLTKNPDDNETRLSYARKLFQLGDFSESKKIISPMLKGNEIIPEAVYLSGQIEYITGNYKGAEDLFNKLRMRNFKDYYLKAETGLLYTYYQTNQFNKAKNLTAALEEDGDKPLKEVMEAFKETKPYNINWNGKSEAVVPFIADEYLPAVSMEVNGRKINAIIDTGGDIFYLDETVASSLNIKTISTVKGTYAGGISVETGYGKLDSISLNGVTIKSVPVILAPIKQFSAIYNNEIEIDGIITTAVLKQFLATMDYPNSRLILRPRNQAGRTLLQQYTSKYKKTKDVPFTLATSHFMTAKGSINGKESLNFFMDSGLASEKTGLILLEQTMSFTGIPMLKAQKKPDDLDNVGGLGGSDFEVSEFRINQFRLGDLPAEKNIWAEHGALEAAFNFEESRGFIIDGLVSHNFLKKYSWTIDFDRMKMIFSQ